MLRPTEHARPLGKITGPPAAGRGRPVLNSTSFFSFFPMGGTFPTYPMKKVCPVFDFLFRFFRRSSLFLIFMGWGGDFCI